VADYSEFPTTPTAWQEAQWEEVRREAARQAQWQQVHRADDEDPAPAPRRTDVVALVAGLLFALIAVVGLTGVDLPVSLFRDGAILWVLLVGGGVLLLISELRKSRNRR
jgi:hypothetical protein